MFWIKGGKRSTSCLLERSTILQLLRAEALLEYSKAAFAPTMLAIGFEGRGWGKALCKDRQQSMGEMMIKVNVVLHLWDKIYEDTTRPVRLLVLHADAIPMKRPVVDGGAANAGEQAGSAMSSCRCRYSCILTPRPFLSAMESERRQGFGAGSGTVCEDS